MLPSDVRQARRAFAIAVLAFVVALLLSAASDEGGVAWTIRLTRALPIAPLAGALGVWLTLSSRRAKADALALEATGRSPKRNSAGAVVGGAGFALLLALVLASWSKLDISAIFPAFSASPRVAWNGEAFVDTEHGLRFAEDGSVALAPEAVTPALALGPSAGRERAAGSLALAFASVAFALLAAAIVRHLSVRAATSIGVVALATVFAFDAVASGRASPFVVVLPPAALSLFAWLEYLRSAWLVPSK
ncbi:MAG TPA: hypothetical protein VF407_00145 [Polyangiaceae bacterium]